MHITQNKKEIDFTSSPYYTISPIEQVICISQYGFRGEYEKCCGVRKRSNLSQAFESAIVMNCSVMNKHFFE
jgi:hypothetical protein